MKASNKSEASKAKAMKAKDTSKTINETEPRPRIINGYRNHQSEMNDQNLNSFRAKKAQAKILRISETGKIYHDYLDLHDWGKYDDGTLKALTSALKRSEEMKELDIICTRCGGVTDTALAALAEGLKGSRRLKRLHLNFTSCWMITDEGVKELSQALKGLVLLESVNINFSESDKITNQGFIMLMKSLKNLHFLKEMNLVLIPADGINNAAMKGLSQAVKKLTFLEKISVDFGWSAKVESDGWQEFYSSFKHLKSLKAVNMDLPGGESAQKMEKDFGQILEGLVLLQGLRLAFRIESGVGKKELEKLGQDLKSMTSLKKLDLAFPEILLIKE